MTVAQFPPGRIWYPVLLLPLAALYALVFIVGDLGRPITSHASAATAAVAMLGLSFLISLIRWFRTRHRYFLLLTVFVACFLLREFRPHGLRIPGFNDGIYLMVLAQALLVWWKYPWFAEYFSGRTTPTLLAGGLASFLTVWGCDAQVFTFVTADLRVLAHVEEFMEVWAHAHTLLLVLLSRPHRPLGQASAA